MSCLPEDNGKKIDLMLAYRNKYCNMAEEIVWPNNNRKGNKKKSSYFKRCIEGPE